MKVCVLCPSRGKPSGLKRLVDSVKRTSNATVHAYIDHDWREEYDAAETGASLTWGPRIGPVASANKLVELWPDYDAYGFLTDDTVVETEGWDRWMEEIVAEAPGRICVLAPSHNLGGMVDMPFVTREWIEQVGWYACPSLYHWCWPTVTALIGDMTAIARAGSEDFRIYHEPGIHNSNVNQRDDDNRKFFEFVSLELPEVVERLRIRMAEAA